jgi:hypothetical protein
MPKMDEDQFCFTWGLGNLGDMGFVPLYAFMLRTYAQLGVARQEMLCIIHLASYHYNSPKGESRPSLEQVASQMGYGHKQRVSEIVSALEERGLLIVTRRPGFTSIYDAHPFAQSAYDLWIQNEAQKQQPRGVTLGSNTPAGSVTPDSNTPTGSVTPHSDGVSLPSVTEEEKEDQGKAEEEKDLVLLRKDELDGVWSQVLEDLALTMAKGTFDDLLRGSRLVEAVNGTWKVQVRHARAIPWLKNRISQGRSFQGIMAAHAPHVKSIEFITEEK